MKFLKLIDKMIPFYSMIPLLSVLVLNFIVYLVAKPIALSKTCLDLTLPIDDKIPFLNWTVLIYLGCYLFWVVNYILSTRESKNKAYAFMCGECTGKLICFLFYVFMPCTMVRANVTGNSVFDNLVRLVYSVDAPVNLLPSLHCFVSMLCYLGIKDDKTVNKWYKVFSFMFAIIICVSTLTTKQHVILDAISGIALAYVSYYVMLVILNKTNKK